MFPKCHIGALYFKTGVKCIFKSITNFLSALTEVLSKEYKARASRLARMGR